MTLQNKKSNETRETNKSAEKKRENSLINTVKVRAGTTLGRRDIISISTTAQIVDTFCDMLQKILHHVQFGYDLPQRKVALRRTLQIIYGMGKFPAAIAFSGLLLVYAYDYFVSTTNFHFASLWNLLESCDSLEVLTKSVHLYQHEINISSLHGWIGNDASEKVWNVSLRLITNHQSTCLHHSLLEFWCDLPKQVLTLLAVLHFAEASRDIPEGNVCQLRLWNDDVELVRH